MKFRENRVDLILNWQTVLCTITCVLVLLATAGFIYRLSLLLEGGVVSGTDPGNWLAYANQLTNESTKASDTTYPPVIPLIIASMSWAISKLTAISILGIAATTVPTLAILFSLRSNSVVIVSVLATTGVFFCVMSTEILAWGGYPQAISQAFLIISISLLAADIYERSQRRLYLVALCASSCIGTWIPGSLFLGLSFSIYICFLLFWRRSDFLRYFSRYGIRILIVTGIFSLPYVFFYFDSREVFFTQSWNPQQNNVADWGGYLARLFRGWPGWLIVLFWTMTVITVLLALLHRCGVREKMNILMFCSLFISSITIYCLTMELRSLNLAMIASWGLWGASLIALKSSEGFQKKFYFILLGCLFFFVSSLIIINTKQSRDIFSYYRLVDIDVKLALDWIKKNSEEGEVVVESGNKYGFQYIWWLEGYAMVPTWSATDTRFFSFEEEKSQVKSAISLLHESDQKFNNKLVDDHGIIWVFHDKDVLINIDSLKALGFLPVFENSKIRIMKR